MSGTLSDLMRQFIVFCGVGLINTAFGLALILILSEVLGVNYIAANALGYAGGLVLAYFLHRNITFKRSAAASWSRAEFITFAVVFIFAYLVQLGALVLLVQIFGVPIWLAQVLAISIYVILNYSGNRMITFQSNMKDQP